MFICAHQIEICVRDRVGQFVFYFSLGSANCDFSNSPSLGEGKKDLEYIRAGRFWPALTFNLIAFLPPFFYTLVDHQF